MSKRTLLKSLAVFTITTLVFCIVAVSVWVYVLARSLRDIGEALSGCEPSDPYEIQDLGHFMMPPSAENLESHCFGLQGWAAYASFDMDPAEVDQFLASTLLDSPPSTTADLLDDTDILPKEIPHSYLYPIFRTSEKDFSNLSADRCPPHFKPVYNRATSPPLTSS